MSVVLNSLIIVTIKAEFSLREGQINKYTNLKVKIKNGLNVILSTTKRNQYY